MSHPPITENHDFHAPWSEELAQWYSDNHGDHLSNRLTIEQAALRPEDKLLDIGCGSGTAVREAVQHLTVGEAVGLDYSPAMVAIAHNQTEDHPKAEQIRFCEGSATDLPFPQNSFTVITAINSLHHWPDAGVGLKEVARVLQPGGRLLICDEVLSAAEQKNRCTFTEEQIRDLLAAQGFHLVKHQNQQIGDEQFVLLEAIPPGNGA